MEVILREDFLSLGYVGDKVRVRGGYARNYLLPRNLAVEASGRNQRILNHELSAIMAKRLRHKAEAEEFGKTLSQVIVEFALKIGKGGKSFGSVSSKDIESKLKTLGYSVDKRQIRIPDPIKTVGLHEVEIKLHSEVFTPVTIKVSADKGSVTENETQDSEVTPKKKRVSKKKEAAQAEEATNS